MAELFCPSSMDWDDRELISLFMDKEERKKVMKKRKENMTRNEHKRFGKSELKTKKNIRRDDGKENTDSSYDTDDDDETDIEWKVSDHCRAMFSEDEFFYEAVILEIVDGDTFKVKFLGYNNEDLVKRDYMLKSNGPTAHKLQEEDAAKFWFVGDYCCALYDGDRKWYEAKIIDFVENDDDEDECAVQFIGYDEVEYVHALRPSRGRTARNLQKRIAEAHQEKEGKYLYGEDDCRSLHSSASDYHSPNSSASDCSSIKIPKRGKSVKRCCCMPRVEPERCASQTACCKNSSSGCVKRNSHSKIHVPTDFPFTQHAANDNGRHESLRNVLISWYMAGCHAGFYQGQKKRSRCTCCQ